MNRLFRNLAPVTDEAWAAIDEEAGRALRQLLAGRRFVDFREPAGFQLAAVPTGRLAEVGDELGDGVGVAVRESQPVLETRTEFTLDRAALEVLERGGEPDLDPVLDAARRAALAEDHAIFGGVPARGLAGITTSSPHEPVEIGDDYSDYPKRVTHAVERLRKAGVGGPYGIALGPRCYGGVLESTERGYPVLEHLRLFLDGPIVPADAVSGAVVISLRGGDYRLVSGADFEIGYASHDGDTVTCFLRESFTFGVLDPSAAVPLVHPS